MEDSSLLLDCNTVAFDDFLTQRAAMGGMYDRLTRGVFMGCLQAFCSDPVRNAGCVATTVAG